MTPSYDLDEFIEECRKGQVRVNSEAKVTAATDFHLYTEADILGFISNGGLEGAIFKDTKKKQKWPTAPSSPPAPMVDAYSFLSIGKRGYLAFYQAPNGQWILKSFKQDQFGATFLPFEQLRERFYSGDK